MRAQSRSWISIAKVQHFNYSLRNQIHNPYLKSLAIIFGDDDPPGDAVEGNKEEKDVAVREDARASAATTDRGGSAVEVGD